MTPNQLEQLRDFLADKTLSFGCKLIRDNEVFIMQDNFTVVEYNVRDPFAYDYGDFEDTFKILGHTVTIARVLWMMNKHAPTDFEPNERFDYHTAWSIEAFGMFTGVGAYNWEEEPKFWNLEKDDLMSQCPETQDFLWNIFKPLIEKK